MNRITFIFCVSVLSAPFAACSEPAVEPERIRTAIARSIPLLEHSAEEFTKHRECFSCHHQTLPILALNQARKRGIAVRQEVIDSQVAWTANFLEHNADRFREGKGTGGQADTAGYALWALAEVDCAPNPITESVSEYLLLRHRDRDHWHPTSQRPPTEASHFTTTFLAIQGLSRFANSAQRERVDQRLEAAKKWLLDTAPNDTEDCVFRLRALKAATASEDEITGAATRLAELQRPDGGWAQLDSAESDAYATATALAALAQVGGLNSTDERYSRGLEFLLKTQNNDGSWHVVTRSKPIQEYFETGFPHAADQFISIIATAWSVVALSIALPAESN